MVALLGLGWGDVADRLKQPTIVEPVDPGQRGELDGLEAPPGSAPVDIVERISTSRSAVQFGHSLAVFFLSTRVAHVTEASSVSPNTPYAISSERPLGLREGIARRTTIDVEARAVVYRDTDVGTGELLRQFPNEAILKLRAYVREQVGQYANLFEKKA